MAKLLFKLNGVPDDEANEIRDVLEQNDIDFYETSAGMWGISFAGIWLKNESQYEPANLLLDDYQKKRYSKAIEDRRIAAENGEAQSLFNAVMAHPIKVTAVLLFVTAVLYLSVAPFFSSTL